MRWEASDRPELETAFEAAGVEYTSRTPRATPRRWATIADGMIADGVTVLAIVNLDSESGAAIQEEAASQGVKTIDYDRLTLGGSADYYVSFDNTVVGELQGQGLADCLGDKPANIIYLNGSPTDNNATLFSAGAHSVLDPITNYTVVGEQAVPDWDNEQAVTIFEQLFTQADGKVDGVLAANDGLGGSVISVLEENGLAGQVPVTGQDATVEGLQNVLAGTQCMTVYKSAKLEAGALADAAIALVNGEEAETTGTTEDGEGGRDVPSILLEPVSITKDNVKDVIDDGGQSAADVCAGEYADAMHRGRHLLTVGGLTGATNARRPGRITRPGRLSFPRTTNPRPQGVPMSQPLLELRGVNKSFGVVHVLHDVDFAVYPGQVTALVGDNGAGKSTLVKIIAGIYGRDTGEYFFDGKPVEVHGPRDVAALGVEVVYQDLALCDNLDIVQNMFLGREEVKRGTLNEPTMESRARETLASLSVRTVKSVRQHVSSLSGGQRQTVAIAKAVLWNSKIVLLDEPTAALGVAQTRQVLDLVRRLADRGLGVVLISHNMTDVSRSPTGSPRSISAAWLPTSRQGGHPQPGGRADHRRPLRRPRHLREPRHRGRLRRNGR